MKVTKTENVITLNSRVTKEGLAKFNECWFHIESQMPYGIKVKKQDVFGIIIDHYHKSIKK